MFRELTDLLTQSIDDITRKWVDDLRQGTRTEIHKQLLTADIVDGIKAMIANVAQAINLGETPDGETLPELSFSDTDPEDSTSKTSQRMASTKPLGGPLSQAHTAANALGKLRHRQVYDIQDVLYEYAKLRQRIWLAMRGNTVASAEKTLDL